MVMLLPLFIMHRNCMQSIFMVSIEKACTRIVSSRAIHYLRWSILHRILPVPAYYLHNIGSILILPSKPILKQDYNFHAHKPHIQIKGMSLLKQTKVKYMQGTQTIPEGNFNNMYFIMIYFFPRFTLLLFFLVYKFG